MKRNEKLDVLSARWYAGETSDAEENELRQELLACETEARHPRNERAAGTARKARTAEAQRNPSTPLQPDDDHPVEALLFAGFRELAAERMPQSPHVATGPFALSASAALPALSASSATTGTPANALPTYRKTRRPVQRLAWRTAAVAAVVAFGIGIGLQFRKPYCYIDGKPVYDRETALAATEYLDGLTALQVPEQILNQLLRN